MNIGVHKLIGGCAGGRPALGLVAAWGRSDRAGACSRRARHLDLSSRARASPAARRKRHCHDQFPARPSCSAGQPPARRRHDTGGLLNLLNGALAGVGGVYLATHSVVVTIIAGVVAVVLAALAVTHLR